MNAARASRLAETASADQIAEARYWVKDVVANPEVIDNVEPADVVLYVDREYEGGWDSFLAETPAPAEVIAQYPTSGGNTVDLRQVYPPGSEWQQVAAVCGGCGADHDNPIMTGPWGGPAEMRRQAEVTAREWAQAHADTCWVKARAGVTA